MDYVFEQMKITIIDNFISEEQIKYLLDFYKDNFNSRRKWGKTYPMTITGLFKDLENRYNNFDTNNCVDWLEIVHWPQNSFQESHKDFASKTTTLTSITYLNEDFIGGETAFEDGTIIKPKKGRTLFFDGQYYKHKVNLIEKGDRYTVPVWYKKTI